MSLQMCEDVSKIILQWNWIISISTKLAYLFIHSFNLWNNEVIFNPLEDGIPAEAHMGLGGPGTTIMKHVSSLKCYI